ncbi:hypothetical protein CYMTET_52071 [Cymbomonas tetramitiformis]|uniref:B30.2/SPRY domain-containing protein n=1 Tax=Cymbomonas tetramitiformis TaxID=36881 RepID=A0AAE0BJQ6_9CHLO|nr:hypothetical protein CYMTET_52071 [Cymbomonas tetramitiformis]
MTKGKNVAKKQCGKQNTHVPKPVGVQKAAVNKNKKHESKKKRGKKGHAADKTKRKETKNLRKELSLFIDGNLEKCKEIKTQRKELSIFIDGNLETQPDLVDCFALNPGDAECLAAARSPRLRLNPEDCHVSLVLGRSGLSAATFEHHRVFARLYCGVRADFGVARGQWYFEVRTSVRRYREQNMSAAYKTGLRVGWSTEDSSLELAEDAQCSDAFGYQQGYVMQSGAAQRYGDAPNCVSGDVVGCFLDLDMGQAFFTFNGEELQEAPAPVVLNAGKRYLPHIFLRNMSCTVNFGALPPWFPPRGRLKVFQPLECAAGGVSAGQEEGGLAVAEKAGEDAAASADAAREGGSASVAEPAGGEIAAVAAAAEEEEVKAEEQEEDKAEEEELEDKDGEENNSDEEVKEGIEDEEDKEDIEDEEDKEDIEDEAVERLLKERKEARRLVEKLDQEGDAAQLEVLPLVRPSNGDDRPEMVMMVGLPGSGKTHWATRYMREAREKRHVLVSADHVLLQIGASCAPDRRRSALLDIRYMSMASNLIPELLEKLLGPRRRNCVLDDANNVLPGVRARRMAPFAGQFRRVAVVCVVEPDEQKRRLLRQLSTSPLGKNKGWYENPGSLCHGFALPTLDEGFDDIVYVEQAAERAGAILEELRSALPAEKLSKKACKKALVDALEQQLREKGFANHAPGDAGASAQEVDAMDGQLGYQVIPGETCSRAMCTICNVKLNGKKMWRTHRKGRAHMRNVSQLLTPTKGAVAKTRPKEKAHVSKVVPPEEEVVRASAAAIHALETAQAAVMQGRGMTWLGTQEYAVDGGMDCKGRQGCTGMDCKGHLM